MKRLLGHKISPQEVTESDIGRLRIKYQKSSMDDDAWENLLRERIMLADRVTKLGGVYSGNWSEFAQSEE